MSEYLFDFFEGHLEEGRRQEIEKAIEESPELKLELQKIKKGSEYVEILSQSQVQMNPLNMPVEQSALATKTLELIHFQTWPRGIKIGAEIFTVVFFVTAAVFIIPWNKMKTLSLSGNTGWVVSEVDRKSTALVDGQDGAEISADAGTEKYPDDEKVAAAVTKTTTTVSQPVAKGAEKSAKVASTTASTTTPMAASPTTTTNPSAAGLPVEGSQSAKAGVGVTDSDDSKKFGYVFRGRIKVANVTSVNPKLIEKVESLGGRKAGEVAIGWKKGTGAYFHFTVPEAKYQELTEFFNGYGKLVISKDKHERKMPDGIIRVIIDVEELNAAANAQPEETR